MHTFGNLSTLDNFLTVPIEKLGGRKHDAILLD